MSGQCLQLPLVHLELMLRDQSLPLLELLELPAPQNLQPEQQVHCLLRWWVLELLVRPRLDRRRSKCLWHPCCSTEFGAELIVQHHTLRILQQEFALPFLRGYLRDQLPLSARCSSLRE